MADDLILPVPELLSAAYLVPTSLDGEAAKTRTRAALRARVPDPLCTAARKMLDVGAVHSVSMSRVPPLPAEFQRHLGVPTELVRRIAGAERFLAFSASWKPGWPPVHESVARACAGALATELGVPLVDTFVPKVLSADKAIASLPDARSWLKLSDWVLVLQSAGDSGLWTTTKGMGRFGLPELQVDNVPPQYGNPWVKLTTGIAGRLLDLWLDALRARGDSAFALVPSTFEVSEADVANAYQMEPEGGGRAQVRLALDPATDDQADSFLTIQPPDVYPGSAAEYFVDACTEVFGAALADIRYLPKTEAMDLAIRNAREMLPSVRTRFLEGDIPLQARLMVKYRVEAPDAAEYPWAYVNSWKDVGTVLGSSASDAIYDEQIRAGRPVVVNADTIVDWGIWIEGQGIVEGGFTDTLVLGHGQCDGSEQLFTSS